MTPHNLNLILAASYLALTLLVGYTIFCAAVRTPTRHWAQIFGTSFALGAGGLSFILFDFSIAGVKPNNVILVGTAIIASIVLIIFWRHQRLIVGTLPSPWHRPDALSGLSGIALIALIAAAVNVCIFAGWPGLNDIDVFGIWLFKAKWVALWPLHPIPAAFFDPNLSYSHQDYPLGLPFFVAGLYAMVGGINESIAKVLCFPIYLSLVCIVYSAMRQFHRRAIALAITAVFSAAPTLCHNAGLLVGETFLVMCLAGTAASLMRWIEMHESGDLMLTALFAVMAAFSKNEGLALLPVFAIAALIIAKSNHQFRPWLRSVAFAVLIIAPWLIFRHYLPKTHEDYGSKLIHPRRLLEHRDRIGYIARHYFPELFDAPQLGVLWYLLILGAIIGWRGLTRGSTFTLWCILIVQLLLYVATFIVTPWPINILLPLITPKLLTQISPIAALLIGLHLRDMQWLRSDKSAAH